MRTASPTGRIAVHPRRRGERNFIAVIAGLLILYVVAALKSFDIIGDVGSEVMRWIGGPDSYDLGAGKAQDRTYAMGGMIASGDGTKGMSGGISKMGAGAGSAAQAIKNKITGAGDEAGSGGDQSDDGSGGTQTEDTVADNGGEVPGSKENNQGNGDNDPDPNNPSPGGGGGNQSSGGGGNAAETAQQAGGSETQSQGEAGHEAGAGVGNDVANAQQQGAQQPTSEGDEQPQQQAQQPAATPTDQAGSGDESKDKGGDMT